MTYRKNFTPLSDSDLDKLKADASLMSASLFSSANGSLTLPAKTVYALVAEVIASREEIFRLQLCEEMDRVVAEELDDEEDLLAFDWLEDGGRVDDMLNSGVFKPAARSTVTNRLPSADIPTPTDLAPDPKDASRRLPRVE